MLSSTSFILLLTLRKNRIIIMRSHNDTKLPIEHGSSCKFYHSRPLTHILVASHLTQSTQLRTIHIKFFPILVSFNTICNK